MRNSGTLQTKHASQIFDCGLWSDAKVNVEKLNGVSTGPEERPPNDCPVILLIRSCCISWNTSQPSGMLEKRKKGSSIKSEPGR